MAYGLNTYSDYNNFRFEGINIKKVMNGFIFLLSGEKLVKTGKKTSHWSSYSKEYVYNNLEDGTKELNDFFADIEKFMKRKK